MPKMTTIETSSKRVQLIMELMVTGYSRAEIFKYVESFGKLDRNGKLIDIKPWDVTERTIDNYIKKANDLFKNESIVDKKMIAGKCYSRYEKLYNRAYKSEDYKTAASIVEKITKLFGVNEESNLPVINNNIINVPLEKSEITDKLIDSLVYPDEN